MPADRCRIADHDRPAHRAHLRIERGLEAHLRPDAGGISGRDRDARQSLVGLAHIR
jgi:hypothetical protein